MNDLAQGRACMEVHARRPWLLELGVALLLACSGAAILSVQQEWAPAAALLLSAVALGLAAEIYLGRFRRLLLERDALVHQTMLAGAVHDLNGLSVISGVCNRSGRLVSVSLWCGADPILSLRVSEWDEAELRGLLSLLAERVQQVQLGLPVRVYLQRLEGQGAGGGNGVAQVRLGTAHRRRLPGMIRNL
jgi:hypothetical protein